MKKNKNCNYSTGKSEQEKKDWNYSPSDGAIQYPMRGTVGAGGTPSRKGRGNVIGTPGNAMTHDEVVGGGHTIEVQKELGDQFTQFAVPESAYPIDTHIKRSENADALGLRDNFGQVPLSGSVICDSSVTSVYGNTDTSRRVYGDFGAVSGGKKVEADGKKSYNKSMEKRNGEEAGDGNGDDKSEGNSEEAGNGKDEGDDADCECKKSDRAVAVNAGGRVIKTIVIAGQIEGHTELGQGQKATKYEELIPQLVEIEENDEIGGLLLILNTVGGDVEAGLALSELIAGMKKPTASLVLGGGHSIGVPLAVSAKRSFIVPSATMTLHPVRVTGMVLSAPQTYVYLSNMQERIIDFVCSHSRISSERFYELMLAREEMSTDLGSVLDGKKAVEEGLIDSLGSLDDAISFLKESR